jgi:hypothetical protein
MAYQINKTDGSLLTTVPDSQIDENSTDLILIGKNYSGFGEAFNENLIKLLENFADTRAPDRPIIGQIWFDVSESKIKVYNGSQFVPVSSATIANTRPDSLSIGDLWYDSVNKQLFFFDGENTVLLAPAFTASQALSGLQIRSILDSLNQTRVITLLYNNGILIGIFAKDAFTPKAPIDGFSGTIEPGFNVGTLSDIKFRVTVTNSERLGGADALTYVRRDTSNIIDGQLRLTSDLGLVIGAASQGNFVINNGNLLIANAASGRTIEISVRKGIEQETSMIVSPDNRSISFYPGFLDSSVDLGGNLTVSGNLTVQGTTTTINTANVTVEDKAIELAVQIGATSTDSNADEGGIILQGTSPKIIIWSNTGNAIYPNMGGGLLSQAWNFNQSINLGTNKTINIDGVPVIEQTSDVPGNQTFRLTTAVTAIDGVSSFGTQSVLNVGSGLPPVANLRIETDSISGKPRISTLSGNLDIELAPNGAGNIALVGSPRITGLADPISGSGGAQDAATREYVDNIFETRTIVLSIDLSDGKSNSYIINNILKDLTPVAEFRVGTIVKMLCSITTNSSTSVDLNPLVSQSTAIFNTPTGTASAVTNVAIGTASLPGAGISITRLIKVFRLEPGPAWALISEIPLPP